MLKRLRAFRDNLRLELQRTSRCEVAPTELVLDIGSGNRPHPRANVLCDRYVFDPKDRFGAPLVRIADRLLIGGDITRLPFRDSAFDFIWCAHVLEHLPDPALALRELERVGRRGYIETPSPVDERLRALPAHKWCVRVEDGELVFSAKPAPVADRCTADWYSSLPDGLRRQIHMRPYERGLVTCHHWEGEIRYRVEDDEPSPPAEETGKSEEKNAHEIKTGGVLPRLMHAYGRWLRRHSDRRLPPLEEILQCPQCDAEIACHEETRTMACRSCGRGYPVVQGIPMMMVESAQDGHGER